jgi:phosphomannomutase/phosphoglucomutase
MFFADRYFGYDDAIYASCRLIEILAASDRTLSQLVADLPQTVVTPEIRVDCPDHLKFDLVGRVHKQLADYADNGRPVGGSELKLRQLVTIDGVRAVFDGGWGLIRASNTQPALVLRFEAVSPAQLSMIRAAIETELESARRECVV